MSSIKDTSPKELAKWKGESTRAAAHLKKVKITSNPVVIGFIFNDAVVKVTIPKPTIESMSAADLQKHIYELVITSAQTGGSA